MNKYDIEGRRHGYWEVKHPNGNTSYKGHCINGKEQGCWETYYIKGGILSKGNYINGKKEGYWVQNYYIHDPHFLYLNI